MVKALLHHEFVLFNEDHHPNHVVCYCPRFFLGSIRNTWDDPAVFRSLDGTPEFWRRQKLDQVPAKISRRYSWRFSRGASLPQNTVFLKRKKQFAKGRTITSYANSLCGNLLQMASTVLTLIAKTLYPDSPGMQSMPQLWKSLHSHWAKPNDQGEDEWNDDLVGLFFNAVPRKDILQAVIDITAEYQEKQAAKSCRLICCPSQDTRAIPGAGPTNLKRCWIGDIPAIVQFSFAAGVFTAAGKCRLQMEGTCIGNHVSPPRRRACRY